MSRGTAITRPSVLGASANGGAPSIPSSARKVVQNLKEIVSNSEDEIYAMLKECSMDPNETVQRLLSQDPFHEVKRKKDKKKEGTSMKDSMESRGRGSSGSGRGGRGAGSFDKGSRPNYPARQPPVDAVGGRGRPLVSRENGGFGNRAPGVGAGPTPPGAIQPRVASSSVSTSSQPPLGSRPGGSFTLGSAMSSSGVLSQTSELSNVNGPSMYSRPSGWGSGATMADIVKASVAPPPPPPEVQMPPLPASNSAPTEPQFMQTPSTGVYASSSDPVLHPIVDPRSSGPQTTPKRDVGIVGNQRPIGERPSPSPMAHLDSADSLNQQSLAVTHPISSSSGSSNNVPSVEAHGSHTMFSGEISADEVSADQAESSTNQPDELEGSAEVSVHSVASRPQSVIGPVQRSAPQQSEGLDWKSSVGQISNNEQDDLESSQEQVLERESPTNADLSSPSTQLQGLSLQEEKPVIIPGHLQVPEADRTRLIFGSFGAGFGSSYGSGFGSDEAQVDEPTTVESTVTESSANPPSSAISSSTASQSYIQQNAISSVNNITSMTEPLSTSDLEDTKSESLHLAQQQQSQPQLQDTQQSQLQSQQQVEQQNQQQIPQQSQQNQQLSQPSQQLSQQTQQLSIQQNQQQPQQQQQQQNVQQPQPPNYPYMPTVQNYPTFGLLTQIPGAQFNSYDGSDSQNSEASRLSGMGLNMPYGDPASYYSPVLRPSPETESRYTPFSATPGVKYPLGAGTAGMLQGLSGSQDVNVSSIGSGSASLTSQASLSQSGQSIAQQPLPIHAAYATQPPGIPLGAHYSTLGYAGYTPYIHPSYYMQSPYSHTSYPPTNTAYGQAPAGSSYPPSAGAGNFPSTATASLKYPMPQFKGSTAGSGTPLSGAGGVYAAYANPSSGYAGMPSVSQGNTAGYDDVGGQYKDGNLFIPNQMNREISGVQNSSYYNLSQQPQHSGYSHAQQAGHMQTHSVAPFATSLYHPSQSGPTAPGHQMMQQPMNTSGSSGQGVGYQQQQRSQQGWNSGF